MRYRVLPYKQGSRGAKALAEELGGKVLKLVGSTFQTNPDDMVINWGNTNAESTIGYWGGTKNKTHLIKVASNKLEFFKLMKEKFPDVIPQFWTDKDSIPDSVFPVVCRTVLAGHSGAGIVIADNRGELVDAPLYVQYVKKKDEYRVHVGKNGEDYQIIAVQRKARKLDVPASNVNWQIRNLVGGFIYTREGFTAPNTVEKTAVDCMRQTGLDFGAVDVIWNENQEKAYVLEINTAPGLEGQTIKDYASFFKGGF